MRRTNTIIIILLTASLLFALGKTSVHCVDWQRVTEIIGRYDKTTDAFSINGTEWRIIWQTTWDSEVDPDLVDLTIFVFIPGQEAAVHEIPTRYAGGVEAGVYNLHDGGRSYYLYIITANLIGYTITVEYDRDSVGGGFFGDSGLTGIVIAIIVTALIVIAIVAFYVMKKKPRIQETSALPPPPPPPS